MWCGEREPRQTHPFPTLAALLQVAGDLAMKEDFFTTASGRRVALCIFVQEKNLGKVGVQRHACMHQRMYEGLSVAARNMLPLSPDITTLPRNMLSHFS